MSLHSDDYFTSRGCDFLVFNNWYNGLFSDSKISGVEMIHHGVRTATNGDVRLHRTPEQWDAIPTFDRREIDTAQQVIRAFLSYPDYDFSYAIEVSPQPGGVLLSIHLERPLPRSLEEVAGFNLEFLPSAYFGRTYLMDLQAGNFPLYPSGPTELREDGTTAPLPLASGTSLALAPDDPERHVKIDALSGTLDLYDGRNKAQNGWYVVRSTIPSGQTGKVIEWSIRAYTIPNWTRKPVIAHSQAGYHPDQQKVAVVELDQNDTPLSEARVIQVAGNGETPEVFAGPAAGWGPYLRYNYLTFDFSEVRTPGIYRIVYGDVISDPFRISVDVYDHAWEPTLDIFFPVQMDHMLVNEAYRVWHGAAHLDDALQAPVDHVHFDLYAQGPTTDSPFTPGEHIPGLNVGGWFDAGDYDIRTQTHNYVIHSLVDTWEAFSPGRDETTVLQSERHVEIHVPDGKPDLLQQIEHGALALVAQYRAVGHAIPGIIVPDLSQYTHLGDGLTMTDGLIYNANLGRLESDGFSSGRFDDRWAFTSRSSALNYGTMAALAAASRALRGFNDTLAEECLTTAIAAWQEEQSRPPDMFSHGNTTGGRFDDAVVRAATELLLTTGDDTYRAALEATWPTIDERFFALAGYALRALPRMPASFAAKVEERAYMYTEGMDEISIGNPFQVPISTGGWAGSGLVVGFAKNNYLLHKAFPDMIDADAVFNGLHYIYGRHPGSNISLVSGVGTRSKQVAYGTNRADYSFIAGGVVPGVLIVQPDFPENKEDWPFLWGENEYVISVGASYIYLVHAAMDLLGRHE